MAVLSAFHADPALRSNALQRLATRVDAGQLTSGPLAWDGEKGSVVGCLIESDDPAVWEERLGLARWLAHALDAVTGSLSAARAHEKAGAILNALQPGRDTGPLGSRVICGMLAEAAAGLDGPLPPDLRCSFDAVTSLHERSLAGEVIDAAAWKAVRKSALAATDGIDAKQAPKARAVGSAMEAAAWDPQRSVIAVADVLRQWQALERLKADEEFGWTAADDAEIRVLLGSMQEKHIVPNPDEKRDVFHLLEEHHPAKATRLRAYIKFGNDHFTVCVDRAASLLIRLLQASG